MSAKTGSLRLGEDIPLPDALPPARPGLLLIHAPAGAAELEPVHLIEGPIALIGRHADSEIALVHDGTVSGRHAKLLWDEGRLVISDLGSRHGTFVNGRQVASVVLGEHDIVRVGATFFKVVLDGAERYGDDRLDGTRRGDTEAEAAARRASDFAGGHRIRQLVEQLDIVALSSVSVVLRGESGTGKEVFARRLHQASGRKGRFIAVNTAALAQGLVESELFGVKRGSFTGAGQDRPGYVREAAGGTLFLDEIGDMRLEAQSCLLRVLQEREVVPVGSTRPEKVDVRVVCATHRDLEQRVEAGQFRGDLFARLQECVFEVPPLRERREDIVPLCRFMLARHGRPDLRLTASFVEPLFYSPLPFNVRELENVLKRAIALARPDARSLTKEDLPDAMRVSWQPGPPATLAEAPMVLVSAAPTAPLDEALRAPMSEAPRTLSSPVTMEGERWTPPTPEGGAPRSVSVIDLAGAQVEVSRELLQGMLAFHRGSLKATAGAFGIGRSALSRLMQVYGLNASQFR